MKLALLTLVLLAGLVVPISVQAYSTTTISNMYYFWWGRTARSDEMAFHLYRTSIHRLYDWLRTQTSNLNVQTENHDIGVNGRLPISTLEGHTVSTPANSFSGVVSALYLVQNGERHRIHDYPTMVAWGLYYVDRIPLPAAERNHYDIEFMDFLLETRHPEGAPLAFADGPYSGYIRGFWYHNRTSVSAADVTSANPNAANPQAVADFLNDQYCLLTSNDCNEWESPGVSHTLNSLFDWSFRTKILGLSS